MMRYIMHILFWVGIAILCIYSALWLLSIKKYPVEYGISFNQQHAASLGLDWQEVYSAMLVDLQPKYIRIAAMWSEIEPLQGTFNFDPVDWMMSEAKKHGAQVQLVVGQKAPRWPECHVPEWTTELSDQQYESALYTYVSQVVNRYKEHPALEFWQVENEGFIHFEFGECENFREDLVIPEVTFVRSLDLDHDIVMTDSGELSTWRRPAKYGDILGTTLYRTVQTPTGATVTYDWLPASFYKLKARLWGKSYNDFFVSELQAEPWFTDSNPTNTSVETQQQLFSPERMKKNMNYAERVGASRVYLWGVEWWYFMKQTHSDARYWEIFMNIDND